MDQSQTVVLDKILRFYQSARHRFLIKKMLLYGSHAKGHATPHSDIDVAVVVDEPDHSKRMEITAGLFHSAFAVDAAIEPRCIFWDEYTCCDPASILSEIIRTGIEVV